MVDLMYHLGWATALRNSVNIILDTSVKVILDKMNICISEL